MARLSCLRLLRLTDFFAATFAWAKTGKRMAARMAMMAMTTRSSMRVKARRAIVDKSVQFGSWEKQGGRGSEVSEVSRGVRGSEGRTHVLAGNKFSGDFWGGGSGGGL